MKNVRNLTDQNRKALLELPAGFPIEYRGKDQDGDWRNWEQGTVESVYFVDGYLQIDIKWWHASSHVCHEYCHEKCCNGPRYWTVSIFETTKPVDFNYRKPYDPQPRLGWYHDEHRLAAVRWSPEGLRAFRALSGDLVLAQTVASLLVGAR